MLHGKICRSVENHHFQFQVMHEKEERGEFLRMQCKKNCLHHGTWRLKVSYSACRILWLSPCDKIAQNRVLWLFPNVLLVLKDYLPVTIIGLWLFWPCLEVVIISEKHFKGIILFPMYPTIRTDMRLNIKIGLRERAFLITCLLPQDGGLTKHQKNAISQPNSTVKSHPRGVLCKNLHFET